MSISSLNTEIKKRIGNRRLIELTNETNTINTINETTLNAACGDAIGTFERITGILHDTDNLVHSSTLCFGVVYFLETYKSRESAVTASQGRNFYTACERLRQMVSISPLTLHNYKDSQGTSEKVKDSDKAEVILKGSGWTNDVPITNDGYS